MSDSDSNSSIDAGDLMSQYRALVAERKELEQAHIEYASSLMHKANVCVAFVTVDGWRRRFAVDNSKTLNVGIDQLARLADVCGPVVESHKEDYAGVELAELRETARVLKKACDEMIELKRG